MPGSARPASPDHPESPILVRSGWFWIDTRGMEAFYLQPPAGLVFPRLAHSLPSGLLAHNLHGRISEPSCSPVHGSSRDYSSRPARRGARRDDAAEGAGDARARAKARRLLQRTRQPRQLQRQRQQRRPQARCHGGRSPGRRTSPRDRPPREPGTPPRRGRGQAGRPGRRPAAGRDPGACSRARRTPPGTGVPGSHRAPGRRRGSTHGERGTLRVRDEQRAPRIFRREFSAGRHLLLPRLRRDARLPARRIAGRARHVRQPAPSRRPEQRLAGRTRTRRRGRQPLQPPVPPAAQGRRLPLDRKPGHGVFRRGGPAPPCPRLPFRHHRAQGARRTPPPERGTLQPAHHQFSPLGFFDT